MDNNKDCHPNDNNPWDDSGSLKPNWQAAATQRPVLYTKKCSLCRGTFIWNVVVNNGVRDLCHKCYPLDQEVVDAALILMSMSRDSWEGKPAKDMTKSSVQPSETLEQLVHSDSKDLAGFTEVPGKSSDSQGSVDTDQIKRPKVRIILKNSPNNDEPAKRIIKIKKPKEEEAAKITKATKPTRKSTRATKGKKPKTCGA